MNYFGVVFYPFNCDLVLYIIILKFCSLLFLYRTLMYYIFYTFYFIHLLDKINF